MTLKDLEIGTSGVIIAVGGEGSLRQHFLDMGVIPGAEVTLMKYAPMGDPMELRIHGYELTLRLADGEKVEIAPLGADRAREEAPREAEAFAETQRTRPGEGEIPCERRGTPCAAGTQRHLPAGNQNCGKTTLFNQLTGPISMWGTFLRHSGPEERFDPRTRRDFGDGLAWNLFPFPLYQRRDCIPAVHSSRASHGNSSTLWMPPTSNETSISPCSSWSWMSPWFWR